MRSLRPHILHRTVVFSRRCNAQNHGPHTTYFQPPPQPPKSRRRFFSGILLGTACFGLGAYGPGWLFGLPMVGLGIVENDVIDPAEEGLVTAMAAAAQDTAARQVPVMDLLRAQDYLELRAGYSVTAKAVGHTCQLPSNLPCEDTEHTGAFTYFTDPVKDWCTWSIYDGHAGPRTSQLLKEFLPSYVGGELWRAKCMDRPYTPNDAHIVRTIKRAFTEFDREIMEDASDRAQSRGGDLSHTVSILAAALSGSCALLSFYDPVNSILRVANTGDSRAVLGRWDNGARKYVAQPMSVDQTGFNEDEVQRLKQDHPDEDPIDPTTGRVLGIAVSRAFGDSRWKWPASITDLVHEKFWGPEPLAKGVTKTPPYLTAEPEVMETRVETGLHPDFLIMASDGLWDNMSSEDAVTCVQQWLEKNNPTDFFEQASGSEALSRRREAPPAPSSNASNLGDGDDTYYDEREKCVKWRVSPKHFVVEDDNCGVHLIKNALGGRRRSLFLGIMSVQPPLSRAVRDDITVHVIFFGVDAEEAMKNF